MDPIRLLDLASQQASWLSVRQETIAHNVSNANTPGYKGRDTVPFEKVLTQTQLDLTTTNALDITAGTDTTGSIGSKPETSWEVTQSGNSVSLEQEMMKAGQVNRDYALNTNIVKAFHAMLMVSVKE